MTVITSYCFKDESIKNIREIDIHQIQVALMEIDVIKSLSKDKSNFGKICMYKAIVNRIHEIAWENEEVQALFESDESFDFIILQVFDPLSFAFQAKYNVPVIGEFSLIISEIYNSILR